MTESNLENSISDHFKHWSEVANGTNEAFKSNLKLELDKYTTTTMVIISPSRYVLYRGVKIPVKNIKTKTKNKFINRYVLNRVTPTNVTAKEQGDYKFSIDVMLTYDK